MRRWFLVTVAAISLLSGPGCHGRLFRKPCDTCAPGSSGGSGSGSGGRLGLGEPVPGSSGRLPPTALPTDDFPPPRIPAESRNYLDPFGPDGRRYQPAPPRRSPPSDVPLTLNDAAPPRRDTGRAANWLDEPLAPAGATVPPRESGPRTDGDLPPRDVRSSLEPAGPTATREAVPGRDGLTSGGAVPPGGHVKLRDSGVRTIVYLHDPATTPDDLAAARAQAEAAGLRFVPVAVAPDNLRDALTTFTRAITDPAAKPVHVVDESGVRAGSLWYLVFRTAEQRSDEVARLRATPLGLPDPASDAGRRYGPALRDAVR